MQALEAQGAEALVLPLIEIEPMDEEDAETLDSLLRELPSYDWIVFTSANGVAAVGERLGPLGEVKVAVVGPATAEAVRALGVEPAFLPQRFAAEEIAPGLGPVEGSRVLLPQADIAEPQLADQLRARGATVDAFAAYRTIEIQPSVAGLSTIKRADVIVLASASAARSLARIEGIDDGSLIVCIGPRTAEAAREAGLSVGLVAEKATADGIIQALLAHYQKPSP